MDDTFEDMVVEDMWDDELCMYLNGEEEGCED